MRDADAPANILVIDADDAGRRLDNLLAERYPHISRMRLRQAIDQRDVTVDGERVPPGWRLAVGARVVARLAEVGPTAMTPEAIPLEILHEDEAIAIVVKPAGMVMHPVKHYRGGTLANALAHHFNQGGGPPVRVGLPHRLDRLTSGIVVVAKTRDALRALSGQFQRRQVRKGYLALVHGRVVEDAGVIDAPIGRDDEATPRWGVRESGRPSRTAFRVVERLPAATLLELEPLTGRTNQIRIHCAHLGHSLVGEPIFGVETDAPPPAERLFLHAHRLEIRHPTTGEALACESPLPRELLALLDARRR